MSTLAVLALVSGALPVRSQPVPPPPTPAAAPSATPEVTPLPTAGSGAPVEPSPANPPAPAATAPPTPPPIIVEPPSAGVTPGGTAVLRVESVLGTIAVTVADPTILDATVDQVTRTIQLHGKVLGATTLTVSDSRGLTRVVPVRVAFPAGSVADAASLRITGNPATPYFIKEQAALAAARQSRARPGATILASPDGIAFNGSLNVDDVTTVDVPVIIQGDGFFSVSGTTRVRVENVAYPRIHPGSLLVSDYPETLKENGVLFTADLAPDQASRFLYYHYNPPGQPDRRVVLRVDNPAPVPAVVQFMSGAAGPGPYEMEVGHLSTQRFLVRLAQNEGTVVTIPPSSAVTLVDQALPAKSVVCNLMQLREIDGAPLKLMLFAQDATDSADNGPASQTLLEGDRPHARGVYEVPEFYFDYAYEMGGPDLAVTIGQIPLPNLREGQALGGDYGVLQQITIRMVNPDHRPAHVALYANPRGGRATGTFLIDRVLVQAHALPPFSNYKLREYTIPANGYASTTIVTMPEGGSSYPLRLIVGPDDGSVPPGAPGSPVY